MQVNVQLNALVALLRGNNTQHRLNKRLTGIHGLLQHFGEKILGIALKETMIFGLPTLKKKKHN